MADGIEYVVLERVTMHGEDDQTFTVSPTGTYEFWQEISRVTAARKNVVLRDHTPENGVFNAIPASDWDAAVEAGTVNEPKKTLTPLKPKATRTRRKKDEAPA